jgi:ribulose-phosphate 3-epimerase
MLLIMTVEPGFGGQKFMTDQLSKIEQARKEIGSKAIWLQVDGGISLDTIESAATAGADTFVAGSAVFNSANPAQMVTDLREKATLSSH